MSPELIVTIIVAFLGSTVITTIISKIADKRAYELKRRDDKEDRERALKSELSGFSKEMKEAKAGLETAVNMFKNEQEENNKKISEITDILKQHTETINTLKDQATKNASSIESLEKEFKTSSKLEKAALRQILGFNLKTRAIKYLDDGEITYQDFEVWMHDFEIYEALGGNSVIADLKREILELPKVYR